MSRRNMLSERMKTREDLIEWLRQMLPDPFDYRGATGAAYDEEIRRFEYCSRPLWGIFSLMAGGDYDRKMTEPYIRRVKAGLRPGTEWSFPEPTTLRRQIVVEMAVYGYGLLCCGEQLLEQLEDKERKRLGEWLYLVNQVELPRGNWYFFLLIINCALRVNGFPYSQDKISFACREIENFYLGGGWSRDGEDCQRDYYIPFAFHLYSMLMKTYDAQCPLPSVKERCLEFEEDFLYWFDRQGRSLPFGRSLTYRFAHVGYWCGAVLSGFYNLDLGKVKGLILNNLNFWAEQPILQDGMLSIGYGYPNLILSEDYNAPGSPMWAFKAFVILALPPEHEFWQTEEMAAEPGGMRAEPWPGFLVVTGKKHHYALSGRQFSHAEIVHHMSKYGKFCYSTAFGWNCSRDVTSANQFAVDSTLALSVTGFSQYAGRGEITGCHVEPDYVYSSWNYGMAAEIESWLIPLDEAYHVRVHRIHTWVELETYEGAFPVAGWNRKFDEPYEREEGVLLQKVRMTSGIWDLIGNRSPLWVRQNPNTNIYSCECSGVAALKGTTDKTDMVFGCLVYGDPDGETPMEQVWREHPQVRIEGALVNTGTKTIMLKEF